MDDPSASLLINAMKPEDVLYRVPLSIKMQDKESRFSTSNVVFSPNGRFAVMAFDNGTISILDSRTLIEIAALTGHRFAVRSILFSRDAKHLITISQERINVWDAMPQSGIYFTPDHQHITVINEGGSIIVTERLNQKKSLTKSVITKLLSKQASDKAMFSSINTVPIIPGLDVLGVDFYNIRSDSNLSNETKELLYRYGAIIDERG